MENGRSGGRSHFNPRPPRGGRLPPVKIYRDRWDFNPRPPRGGRRGHCPPGSRCTRHFNPRPPRGGRLNGALETLDGGLFQSTPSSRRATGKVKSRFSQDFEFQSTPSSRRATLRIQGFLEPIEISIHALLAEGDSLLFPWCTAPYKFQSTPSSRRATLFLK